jgi:hypothetical protein
MQLPFYYGFLVTSNFPADAKETEGPVTVTGTLFHLAPQGGLLRSEVSIRKTAPAARDRPRIRCVSAVATPATPEMLEAFTRSCEETGAGKWLAESRAWAEEGVAFLAGNRYWGKGKGVIKDLDDLIALVEAHGLFSVYEYNGGRRGDEVVFVDVRALRGRD